MLEVIQKAQELGAAIADSQVLDHLNLAEDAMYDDADARLLMNSYQQKQQKLSDMQTQNSSPEVMSEAITELRGMAGQLRENHLINTYMQAQQAFNEMMQQVNSILRFCITGEEEDACGDCASCGGGCGHDHGHDHGHEH